MGIGVQPSDQHGQVNRHPSLVCWAGGAVPAPVQAGSIDPLELDLTSSRWAARCAARSECRLEASPHPGRLPYGFPSVQPGKEIRWNHSGSDPRWLNSSSPAATALPAAFDASSASAVSERYDPGREDPPSVPRPSSSQVPPAQAVAGSAASSVPEMPISSLVAARTIWLSPSEAPQLPEPLFRGSLVQIRRCPRHGQPGQSRADRTLDEPGQQRKHRKKVSSPGPARAPDGT